MLLNLEYIRVTMHLWGCVYVCLSSSVLVPGTEIITSGTRWWPASTMSSVSSAGSSTTATSWSETWRATSAPAKWLSLRCVCVCKTPIYACTVYMCIWVTITYNLARTFPHCASLQSRYGDGEDKNQVQGVVMDQTGNVVHRFGGSWHEGIFCDTLPNPQCLWKPSESRHCFSSLQHQF